MRDYDLIPFRTLLDQVVVPARRHLREILLPVALPIMIGGLLLTVSQAVWLESLYSSDADDIGAGFCVGFVAYMGIAVALMGVYFLAFAVLIFASADAVAGRPINMGRSWKTVFKPEVLWAIFLLTVAYFGSLILCIVPALYVVPLLTFVLPAMAEEKLSWSQAFERSVELIHFNPSGRISQSPFVQTFVLLAVGLIFNYAITLAVQGPFTIVQQILIQREAFSGSLDEADMMRTVTWLQVPAVVLGSLATAIAWFYTSFGSVILFRELRRRKEAPDLEAAIGQLTA